MNVATQQRVIQFSVGPLCRQAGSHTLCQIDAASHCRYRNKAKRPRPNKLFAFDRTWRNVTGAISHSSMRFQILPTVDVGIPRMSEACF